MKSTTKSKKSEVLLKDLVKRTAEKRDTAIDVKLLRLRVLLGASSS